VRAPEGSGRGGGKSVASAPPERPAIDVAARAPAAPVYDVPAAAAPGGDNLPPPPDLTGVKAALKKFFADRGIKSDAILTIMALDRVQGGYRMEIAKARQAALGGRYDEAMRLIESALEAMDPDHLAGRLQLLRALDMLARESGHFERSREIRQKLADTQKALLATLSKAARDGDLPDDKLKKVLAHLEALERQRADVQRSTDWLSGAEMSKDEPLDALSK